MTAADEGKVARRGGKQVRKTSGDPDLSSNRLISIQDISFRPFRPMNYWMGKFSPPPHTHSMRVGAKIVAFTLALAGGWHTLRFVSDTGNAQELALSEADYADGSKRFAAVSKKITPSLKEDFLEKGFKWGSPVFLRAFKEENTLELWVKKDGNFHLFRSYRIAAASGVLGPKEKEGDGQVPEGFYYVTRSQMNPQSDFHLSFNIGYPNRFDKALGRTGSFIMIHGSNVSIGCLAMTDAKIEEIYTIADAALNGGQKFFRVHLFPFRMTEEKMKSHSASKWHSFWQNLQTGYQWFEEKKTPPNVTVEDGRYLFK
jgi:murein L,D-transpeptidase YafK